MAAPQKYAHIDFTPPAGARKEAEQGLKLRREHGRGGTAVGIARARDISNGVELSPSTVRRMKAFFDRHASDSKAEGFRRGEKGWPSNGVIANKLWGGPAGYAWAKKVVAQMERADEEDRSTYSLDAETSTIKAGTDRRSSVIPNVERRFLGNFSETEEANPDLLKVEERADPETGKKQTYLVGYAARFGKNSLLLGDFVERIAPTAFEIVEKRKDADGKPLETRCLFNHSPDNLLGRFPTTMRMWVDDVGLRYECLLPETRKDIAELVARGDLKGSSFSFIVAEGGEKWSTEEGRSLRLVTKIKSLLDCGPVTYPAYDSATVAVAKRSYDQFVAGKAPAAVVEKRDSGISARAAEEARKTQEFLAERRGFCATGEGGGVDNSCGGDGPGTSGGPDTGEAKASFGKDVSKAAESLGVAEKSIAIAAEAMGKDSSVSVRKGSIVIKSKDGSTMTIKKDHNSKGAVASISRAEGGLGKTTKEISGFVEKYVDAAKKSGVDGVRFQLGESSAARGKEYWDPQDKKAASVLQKSGFMGLQDHVPKGMLSKSKNTPTYYTKYFKSDRSIDELHAFLAERRGFCPTGPGGGIDNSCGKSNPGVTEATQSKMTKGAVIGAKVGAVTTGNVIGGALAGAVIGSFLKEESAALDKQYHFTGLSKDKVAKAAKVIGDDVHVSPDYEGVTLKSKNVEVKVEHGDEWQEAGQTAKGTNAHFRFTRDDGYDAKPSDIKDIIKTGKALGVNHVSVVVSADDKNTIAKFEAKGFKVVRAEKGSAAILSKEIKEYDKSQRPGEYRPKEQKKGLAEKVLDYSVLAHAASDVIKTGVKAKTIADLPKLASKALKTVDATFEKVPRKRMDELHAFLAERRGFCPTGEGGGIDNSCNAGSGGKGKDGGEKSEGPKKTPPGDGGKSPMLGKMLDKIDKLAKDAKSPGGAAKDGGKSSVLGKMIDRIAKGEKGSGGTAGGKGASEKYKKTDDEDTDWLGRKKSDGPNWLGNDVQKTIEKVVASGGKADGPSAETKGDYKEWSKGDHKDSEKVKKAQDFLDKARTGQLARGGKDGGKADDGGGVQTWSKGDHFPWTTKQVGTDKGYIQGQHPDGSKTAKYPFEGDPSEAHKKVYEEIKSKKKDKRSITLAEMTEFLMERAGR